MNDPLQRPAEAIQSVYAYVAYRIGPGPDADDVTSATIERAIRYRSSYRRGEGTPTAWLIGIARRCLVDAAVARSREVPTDEEFGVAVADVAGAAASRIDLQRALATLDERSCDLIALRFGADLSSKQIGVILGMTFRAVDVALFRALEKLRDELEKPSPASTELASRPA